MSLLTYPTLAALGLLAGIGLAHAQTDQNHQEHHPQGPVAASPAVSPPAGPDGMTMAKMMDRHMQMMPMMARGMGSGGEMRMMPSEHVEGRIAFLKAELKITEDQLPQWNTFAETLRGNAEAMRAMSNHMQSGMPATLPARLDAMAEMMGAKLDGLKKTAGTTKSLYAVLSEAQKKAADDLIMSPMAGM